MSFPLYDKLEWLENRYQTCLHGENHDRPLLFITSRPQEECPISKNLDIRENWFDFSRGLERFAWQVDHMHYAGESYPHLFCNLGPDIFTAFTGSQLSFDEHTSWAHPRVDDWAQEPTLSFNPQNEYWLAMEKFLSESAAAGRGKWITATGDIHSGADCLSALRGPDRLSLDLIESPDEIKRRLAECMNIFHEVSRRTHALIHESNRGFATGWLPLLVRGRHITLQNDYSCMVSPRMFREFFLPILQAECDTNDTNVYHLDGPDALKHVDALCEIKNLDFIQWIPGAGQKPMQEWGSVLHRLQDAGKGLLLTISAEEILSTIPLIRPEKVMLVTNVETPQEADDLVRAVESFYQSSKRS